jgi:hypothetical protein
MSLRDLTLCLSLPAELGSNARRTCSVTAPKAYMGISKNGYNLISHFQTKRLWSNSARHDLSG